mmetsp:Transcript_27626/g.75244  ORF Transcript_27626/g.75244 Transcript_27626/m.75244 type:complete len:282 (-) Transcript_27626:1334-2179(-)
MVRLCVHLTGRPGAPGARDRVADCVRGVVRPRAHTGPERTRRHEVVRCGLTPGRPCQLRRARVVPVGDVHFHVCGRDFDAAASLLRLRPDPRRAAPLVQLLGAAETNVAAQAARGSMGARPCRWHHERGYNVQRTARERGGVGRCPIQGRSASIRGRADGGERPYRDLRDRGEDPSDLRPLRAACAGDTAAARVQPAAKGAHTARADTELAETNEQPGEPGLRRAQQAGGELYRQPVTERELPQDRRGRQHELDDLSERGGRRPLNGTQRRRTCEWASKSA